MKLSSLFIVEILIGLFFFMFTISCIDENEEQNNTLTDSRDGNIYKTVTIGEQTWMAENLAYLPSVSPSSEGSKTEPYYYVNDYQGTSISAAKATNNYIIYGVFYNWTAALDACPEGWHLPTDDEWKQLEIYIGLSKNEANDSGYRGTIEGNQLKSTTGWDDNGNGSDAYNFTGLPAGYRAASGKFNDIGTWCRWWCSTKIDASYAWHRFLCNISACVNRHRGCREGGISVRCVRD